MGAERGLIDATVATELAGATTLWQNFDGFMRMASVDGDPASLSPAEQSILAQACGAVGVEDLAARIAEARQRSAAHIDAWFAAQR